MGSRAPLLRLVKRIQTLRKTKYYFQSLELVCNVNGAKFVCLGGNACSISCRWVWVGQTAKEQGTPPLSKKKNSILRYTTSSRPHCGRVSEKWDFLRWSFPQDSSQQSASPAQVPLGWPHLFPLGPLLTTILISRPRLPRKGDQCMSAHEWGNDCLWFSEGKQEHQSQEQSQGRFPVRGMWWSCISNMGIHTLIENTVLLAA